MADKGLISRSIVQGFADEVRRLTGVETTGTPAEVLGWLKEYEGGGGKGFVSYSGNYTVDEIVVDDVTKNLYTIFGSGTLVLKNNVQIWMCGGGGNGANAITNYGGGGGGGGYTFSGVLQKGTHVVNIGGAGGATEIVNEDGTKAIANPGSSGDSKNGGAGGSGGGGGGYRSYSNSAVAGTGTLLSTYPFGLTELEAHCGGGGGGGGATYDSTNEMTTGNNGGAGGTNGSDGKVVTGTAAFGGYNSRYGGTGGTKGGGSGGTATTASSNSTAGGNATFYGSGGGGGAYSSNGSRTTAGGSGYQGVVYILEEVS